MRGETKTMDGVSYNNKSILERYDSVPTEDSTNLLTSGVIKEYVDSKNEELKSYVDLNDGTLTGRVVNVENQLANQFNFKGSVTAVTDLPATGNTINDTYYVINENCMYTWNGTAWSQSSMDETDYLSMINQLKTTIATAFDATKAYELDDVVLYNGDVYLCTKAVTKPGDWTGTTNWTKMSMGDIVSNTRHDIVPVVENLQNDFTDFREEFSKVENLVTQPYDYIYSLDGTVIYVAGKNLIISPPEDDPDRVTVDVENEELIFKKVV